MSRAITTLDLSSFRLDGLVRYPFEASGFIEAGVVHATDQESVLRSSAYIARAIRVRTWPDDPAPTKNYVGHKADVAHHAVLLPEGATERLKDPETLWNAIEATNATRDRRTRKNRFKKRARTAETFIADLPVCSALSEAQQIDLAVTFFHERFVQAGLAVELAVHRYRDPIPVSKLKRATEDDSEGLAHAYMRRFTPPIFDIASRHSLPKRPPITGPHALRFIEDGETYLIPYGPHVHALRTLQPILGETIGRKRDFRHLDPPFKSTRRERIENGVWYWNGIDTRGQAPELVAAWRNHQLAYFQKHSLDIEILPPVRVFRRRTKSREALSQSSTWEPEILAGIIARCDGAIDLHSLAALAAAAGVNAEMPEIVARLAAHRDVVCLGGVFLSAGTPGAPSIAARSCSQVVQRYLEAHGRDFRPTPWEAFERACEEADADEPWPEGLLASCAAHAAAVERRALARASSSDVRSHIELSLRLIKSAQPQIERDEQAFPVAPKATSPKETARLMRAPTTTRGRGSSELEDAVAREMRRSEREFDLSEDEPPPLERPKQNEVLVFLNGRLQRCRKADPIFRSCENSELAAMLQHAQREAETDPFRASEHERAYRALRKFAAMRGMNPDAPTQMKIDTALFDFNLGKRFIDHGVGGMRGMGKPFAGRSTAGPERREPTRQLER